MVDVYETRLPAHMFETRRWLNRKISRNQLNGHKQGSIPLFRGKRSLYE
jgi:hypothetical protein